VVFVLALVPWLYFAGLEASPLQATLGKRLAGLRVVDRRGGRVGFWTATLRYVFTPSALRLVVLELPSSEPLSHDTHTGTRVVLASRRRERG
jgi:uncharacterized RDD family membrane protein YckC